MRAKYYIRGISPRWPVSPRSSHRIRASAGRITVPAFVRTVPVNCQYPIAGEQHTRDVVTTAADRLLLLKCATRQWHACCSATPASRTAKRMSGCGRTEQKEELSEGNRRMANESRGIAGRTAGARSVYDLQQCCRVCLSQASGVRRPVL